MTSTDATREFAGPIRYELDGAALDDVDLSGAMEIVAEACRTGRSLQVVTVNLNFLTLAARLPDFRNVLRNPGLAVIDGRPLLWLARLRHPALKATQVTGHDLLHACIPLAAERGYRVLLLGGQPGVAAEAVARLARDHPGLIIEASDGGSFTSDGHAERGDVLLAEIRSFAPQMIFVALGAPKQDLWIARNLATLPPAVAIGVGGVFDTLAGRLRRAPRWVQVAGLESPFQLMIEPRRYARRYLIDDPPTLFRVMWSALRGRRRNKRRSSV
jgi:N-acetylglucosaminyldiphosphoundecaprenol N-acetyl-beta-D-mannosaminyltransferase